MSAVERESPETAAGVAAPGRTRVPADTEEGDEREALSGELRGAEFGDAAAVLAELLDPVAFDPAVKVENVGQSWDRYRRQEAAFAHAVNALRAGFRLVSEDEATVDRVARAIHAAECGPEAHCNLTTEHFAWDVRLARAAVRALLCEPCDREVEAEATGRALREAGE